MKKTFVFLALAGAFALLSRSALADANNAVVALSADGIVVTVNAPGASVHFDYVQDCGGGVPCYAITLGQGVGGVPTTVSGGCTVKGGGDTITGVQCPVGSGSIQFKMVGGGSWSAYQGGGGLHTGSSCSPARVIVAGGNGPYPTTIDSWNGCHEVVQCGTSGTVAVEADASDDISGKCLSVVKH